MEDFYNMSEALSSVSNHTHTYTRMHMKAGQVMSAVEKDV